MCPWQVGGDERQAEDAVRPCSEPKEEPTGGGHDGPRKDEEAAHPSRAARGVVLRNPLQAFSNQACRKYVLQKLCVFRILVSAKRVTTSAGTADFKLQFRGEGVWGRGRQHKWNRFDSVFGNHLHKPPAPNVAFPNPPRSHHSRQRMRIPT